MTAQVGDKFEYNGKRYTYVMKTDHIGFSPRDYGITPAYTCTACWAGYWCEYSINENGLFLKNLFVNSMDDNYPDIEGVSVSGDEERSLVMGHHAYRNINKLIKYTGKLLLGNDFMPQYYVHMGYQGYWTYRELLQFVFVDGALVAVNDVSRIAAMKRRQLHEDKRSRFGKCPLVGAFGFTEAEYKSFCKGGEEAFLNDMAFNYPTLKPEQTDETPLGDLSE